MELWIRSQDKEKLIKSENFKYGFGIYGHIILNGEIILGEYKSKERALEVLDEIEKTIINIGLPWNEQNKKIAIGRHIIFNMVTQLAIYEMPKE